MCGDELPSVERARRAGFAALQVLPKSLTYIPKGENALYVIQFISKLGCRLHLTT